MTMTSHDCCILPEQLNCQPARERVSIGKGAVARAGAKQNMVFPEKIRVTMTPTIFRANHNPPFDFIFAKESLQLLLGSASL